MPRKDTTPSTDTGEKNDASELFSDTHMSIRLIACFQKSDTVFAYMTGFECV